MENEILDSPSTSAELTDYAGFWLRFAAYIIDALLIGVVYWIFAAVFLGGSAMAFGGLDGMEEMSEGQAVAMGGSFMLIQLFTIVAQWLYFAFMESSEKQATLGKMAIGIKVTDMHGQRISFGRATGRYFGKILSSLILLIGYIMAGFTDKKQALHDMIAGTLVLRK